MYLNSNINLNPAKIYLDSKKVYLNLRNSEIHILILLNLDKFFLNLNSSLNL